MVCRYRILMDSILGNLTLPYIILETENYNNTQVHIAIEHKNWSMHIISYRKAVVLNKLKSHLIFHFFM